MRHRFTCLFALALIFPPLAGISAEATRAEVESTSHVLVTFTGRLAGKSSNKPTPGKYYRYRSRYRVSAATRKHAEALATEFEMTLVDDWPIESLRVYCVVYSLAQTVALPELLDKLNRDPRVESAQEMHDFEGATLPTVPYNDSYAGYQYALESMNVSQAHKYADGKGVEIAVIDSGVDLQHEDLQLHRIRSRDFVSPGHESSSSAHGTAVVSLIAANPNNGKGIVGVAPAAKLISLRACWTNGDSETAHCDSFTLAKALDYVARSRPDLINLSISGPEDPLLGRLIDRVLQNGTVIVAALPQSASAERTYPAGHAGVLAVSAAPAMTGPAAASERPSHALLAPGEQIMVALPGDGYDFRSGSSLAAANASGVIALLLEHEPGLDGTQIADILRRSGSGNVPGGVTINACRALAEVDIAESCQ